MTVPLPRQKIPLDLDEVYRQHAAFVWRIAAARGVPLDQREDVVHDVFLVVHRRAADYDPAHALTSWLYGITRWVLANRRRRFGRHARKLRVLEPRVEAPDIEIEQETRRQIALVQNFLETLTVRRRLVFELVHLEGLTGPEVAAALEIPISAVYTRLRAARSAFHTWIAGHRAGARGREQGASRNAE